MSEFLNTVTLFGVLQGAGLALLLFRRRENHLASQVLGALVGAVALMLLLGFVGQRWGFQGHPHLLGLGAPLPYLFSPLLCLYVLTLTRPLERFDARQLVHGLPFLANLAYMAQAFYLRDAGTKLAIARAHDAGDVAPMMRFFMAVQLAQALLYLSMAYAALRRHARRMEGYYSELSQLDLRWLSVIVLVNVGVWSLVGLRYLAQLLSWQPSWFSYLDPGVQLGSALFVFLIGYLFLWQPELVQKARAARALEEQSAHPDLAGESYAAVVAAAAPAQAQSLIEDGKAPIAPDPTPMQVEQSETAIAPEFSQPEIPGSAPRYQRNRLDEQEALRLVEDLRRLMREEEPYLNGSLTVQDLADELGITPHLLSQVLNVYMDRTFYQFVNEHRTATLMTALTDPARAERGVLELALEAGFGSKSTLNSFFKKHTGMTPTQYRRQALRMT